VGVVATTAVVPMEPKRVFACMTDPAEVMKLSPEIEAFELSGAPGPGTKVRETRRVLGRRMRLEWTITDYEPNRRIVLSWSGRSVQVTGAVTFEPVADGTRISTHNELRSRGVFRLLEPLVRRAVAREERVIFERMGGRIG
jgi:uncharacterized protein YndB with AHSA1/START domain